MYSKDAESVAAPTAGLHFTKEHLSRLERKGVELLYITLHIGLDTFRPVRSTLVEDHQIHAEHFQIDNEAANLINDAKRKGGRIIAIGTTSARVIETVAKLQNTSNGEYLIKSFEGQTDLFIYPGYDFKIVDGMVTNFHLPKSTLLMMVSAFGGRELILNAYQEAIEQKYRFFSFGDAMLII